MKAGLARGPDGRPRCGWGVSTEDYVAYHWRRDQGRIALELTGSAESAYVRIRLPKDVARLPHKRRPYTDQPHSSPRLWLR